MTRTRRRGRRINTTFVVFSELIDYFCGMDKKIQGREILYVKPTKESYDSPTVNKGFMDEKALIASTIKALPDKLVFKAPNKIITALSVVDWINTHPLFKWSGMCLKLGIDKGNFGRLLKSPKPELKVEVLNKVVEFLREYRFEG